MMFCKIIETEIGLKVKKEHFFHPTRKWRFDYAIIDEKIAIEVEGGAFTNGRHTRGKGFIEDMAKYNEAVKLGWRLLRFTPDQLYTKTTLDSIKELLKQTV